MWFLLNIRQNQGFDWKPHLFRGSKNLLNVNIALYKLLTTASGSLATLPY